MMKISFLAVLAILFVSCDGNKQKKHASFDDPEKIEIRYAENFKLKKIKDGYLLELLKPGTKDVSETYEIYPSENKKIISLTATLNGMLAALNSQDLIVGISDYDHVYDSGIRSRFKNGGVKEYGGTAQNSLEKLVASEANIIFYDIVDEQFPNQQKLKKFGIQVMPIYDWRENHPLAKAEWIKVVGAITGKIKEANAFFDQVEKDYNILKNLGKNYSKKPTVLCGNLIGDSWYTPSGNNYYAMMIEDAGGDYRYKTTKGTISLALSIEQILNDNLKTEIWLNPGYKDKTTILKTNPHAKHLGAFKNNVYCYSNGMKKFWEQSASRPDLVLSDMIVLFHPEDKSIGTLNFYSQIN
ncbi:MAG: ABC transporter substrate-binding protein [Crocinitomicaceae bacterium]|jgi:iron complex transport system substrate-binding protein|nr:ABC transporter substrate-binding protein [Crocinitomicaceae bacterium]MDC0100463.1 ABC transporter substrate-binding protein [Crocinitomicaceae bacterium]|tara:strand:- start:5735 stop:6799 length:1065 start_codon:yes stop_codon:yes gene_type:complete